MRMENCDWQYADDKILIMLLQYALARASRDLFPPCFSLFSILL